MSAGLDQGNVEETAPIGASPSGETIPGRPLSPEEQAKLDQAEAGLQNGDTTTEPANGSSGGSGGISSGIDMAKSATSSAKNVRRIGMFAAFGGLGFILIGIVVAIILFLLGFKLDHIKNLFIDYQFAGYHRSLSLRIDHIITSDAILSDESLGKLPTAGRASLYERLRGYSPNGALKTLGKEGFQLDFDKSSIPGKQGQLRAFKDATTGKTVYRSSKAPAQLGPNEVKMGDGEFLREMEKSINGKLYNESNFFRRRTVSDVYERSGIKLIKFKLILDKLKNGGKVSQADAEKLNRQEEADSVRRGTTGNSDVKNEADKQLQQAVDGEPLDIQPDKIPAKFEGLKTVGKFSQFAFWATIYCIVTDIRDSIPDALSKRVDNSISIAADTFTKADQQKEGKAPLEGINASAKQFDGFEQSAAYQRAMGLPVSGQDLDPQDYPETVMGFKPTDVGKFLNVVDGTMTGPFCSVPGLKSICGSAITTACSTILNPYAQGTLAIIEGVITVLTLGGEEAAGQSAGRIAAELAPDLLKLGAGIGLSEYLFGHVIPSMISDVSGVSAAGLAGPVDRTNRLDAGTNLMKNEFAATSGATPISYQTAMAQNTLARAQETSAAKAKGPAYALFNLNNTYSVASIALATVPTSLHTALANFSGSVASIFQPTSFFKAFAGTASATVSPKGEAAFYGIQQYGWDDSVLDGSNEAYNFVNNQAYIEGSDLGVDGYKAKYAKCLGAKADVRMLGNDPNDPSFDYSKCAEYSTTDDYKHYGVYVLDCFSVEQLVATGSNADTFHQSECSDLIGASDSGAATPVSNTPANKNIYILGDSIMRIADQANHDIKGKLTTAGYTNVTVNWDGGRSIVDKGHDIKQSGLEAVAADKATIAAAGTIVIELGTNYADTEANMKNIMAQLKAINSTARYYWINVGSLGHLEAGYAKNTSEIFAQYNAENALITKLAPTLGYQPIDWCSLVFTGSPCKTTANAKTGMLAPDGVHPSEPKGITDYINLLIHAAPVPTDSTGPGNGVVAGSIVQTAIGLAWPDDKYDKQGIMLASPAFKAAVDPGVEPTSEFGYTDCSVFVATVMKKSGVDKNYVYYTESQLPYVKSHPEKYYVFSPSSTADLKPGDILLVHNGSDHHTMIYIGPQPGKPDYTGAEASANDRVPMLVKNGNITWMLGRPEVVAVRVK